MNQKQRKAKVKRVREMYKAKGAEKREYKRQARIRKEKEAQQKLEEEQKEFTALMDLFK